MKHTQKKLNANVHCTRYFWPLGHFWRRQSMQIVAFQAVEPGLVALRKHLLPPSLQSPLRLPLAQPGDDVGEVS